MGRVRARWGFSTGPPYSNRYRPGGSCTRAAIFSRASAMNPPRSRPRTLQVTDTRRWVHSRVIVFGPSITSMVASRASGIRSPDGVGSRIAPIASGLARRASGRRMTSGNWSCPS